MPGCGAKPRVRASPRTPSTSCYRSAFPLVNFDFLPSFSFSPNGFALFGAILLAGLLGGELAARSRIFPRITGYLAVGALFGPIGLNLIGGETIGDLRFFADISLGLILFDLGRRLNLQWLRHDPWLLPTGLAEGLLSFALIFFALRHFDIEPLQAAMAAAIGIATSPSVVLLVAQELGAEGPVTRRTLALTALNNILALVVFTAMLSFVHLSSRAEWLPAFLHPLYRLAGSLFLGYLAHLATLWMARFAGKNEAPQFLLLIGAIALAVGAAKTLNLSVLMTLLTFGLMAKNLDHRRALLNVEFGNAGLIFFVVLFVATGAMMPWPGGQGWPIAAAAAFLVARSVGKAAGSLVSFASGGLNLRQTAMTAIALTPMAGVALGMTQTVADIYPEFGAKLAAIVVTAITVLHVVGPVAVHFAFRAAGETRSGNG